MASNRGSDQDNKEHEEKRKKLVADVGKILKEVEQDKKKLEKAMKDLQSEA